MAGPRWQKAQAFHQVGIVVPDLAKSMTTMSNALGVRRQDWVVFGHEHPFEHHEGDRVIEARIRYARPQSVATVYQPERGLLDQGGERMAWGASAKATRSFSTA